MTQETNKHVATFKLDGNPTPWQRPGRSGDRYYDNQSAAKLVSKSIFKSQMIIQNISKHLKGPLKLEVDFYIQIPASYSKKRKEVLEGQWHDKKPDNDNLLKFINDAAQEILFQDDCQIAYIISRKIWSLEPSTEITISEL